MKVHLNLCSQMCWYKTYWCLSADTEILPSRVFQVFFNNKKYRSEQEKDFGQYIYTYKYHPPIGWFEKTYNHMASYIIIEMFEQYAKSGERQPNCCLFCAALCWGIFGVLFCTFGIFIGFNSPAMSFQIDLTCKGLALGKLK